MAKIITYPLNNIDYTAEDAELFHCNRESGVFGGDDFTIEVTGTNNQITINEGIGWIRNTRFAGKSIAMKEPTVLTLPDSDATYSRIDAVVLRFSPVENKTELIVKQGIAAESPEPPIVERTGAVYELHLYHIRRTANTNVVTERDITSVIADRAYCGYVISPLDAVDKTLTKSGYAADALATGEMITSLADDILSGCNWGDKLSIIKFQNGFKIYFFRDEITIKGNQYREIVKYFSQSETFKSTPVVLSNVYTNSPNEIMISVTNVTNAAVAFKVQNNSTKQETIHYVIAAFGK